MSTLYNFSLQSFHFSIQDFPGRVLWFFPNVFCVHTVSEYSCDPPCSQSLYRPQKLNATASNLTWKKEEKREKSRFHQVDRKIIRWKRRMEKHVFRKERIKKSIFRFRFAFPSQFNETTLLFESWATSGKTPWALISQLFNSKLQTATDQIIW